MFESGLDIIMVPLEVTHTALVTNEVMAGEHWLDIIEVELATETQMPWGVAQLLCCKMNLPDSSFC